MIRRTVLLILPLLVVAVPLLSQHGRTISRGTITGQVIGSESGLPIEYVSIVLYAQRDSIQVAGTITDDSGGFQLAGISPGLYFLDVSFIGYHGQKFEDIVLRRDRMAVDLGKISLEQTVLIMEGDEVVAEKPAFEYRIDKKVINVDQQSTTPSGNAVDVLENVPSVTVDIEGNVQLRGSSSFTVLVDGRQSLLEPSEALQQIPASSIDNIEIITNPSARYDPDGTSGIINVVLKKTGFSGRSGIVNANAGLDDKYGADFLVNFRERNLNASFGVDYNRRIYPGTSLQENRTSRNDSTSFVNSRGDSRHKRRSFGLRGTVELFPRSKDHLSLGLRYGSYAMGRDADLDYDEWTDPGGEHNLYRSRSDRERSSDFYTANLDYRHRFAREGHEISGQVILNRWDSEEETSDELIDRDGTITSGRLSTEDGPSDQLRTKLDYSLPLSETNKIESGYQSRYRRSEDITELKEYDPARGVYVLQPEFSHTTDYSRDIHSIYGIYSGERGRLGYQGGIRGEYTNRLVEVARSGENFTIDRWDLFPTAHISYQFSGGRQFMASYARRIERPRGWYLEPFETWVDAFNVRRGNPELQPEYIDSYELGFQTDLGRHFLSTEAYYRVTHNKIERVRSVYDENVTLRTNENMGELLGESFSRDSFNWNSRLHHTLRFRRSTQVQVTGIYNSPTASSQGRREGFFTTNASVRQDFFDGAMTASVQVSDIFKTAEYESSSEGANFDLYSLHTRRAPVVMLNISYNINNYKPERRRDRGREENGEGEEF
jgi:outer membrane receptor protein involved in Fe transport